jgi:outer membrane protein assembly factor BamB
MPAETLTRRQALAWTAAAVLTAANEKPAPAETAAANTSNRSADWPMASGPFGNYTARRYGHRLVEDLAHTRLLWQSDDQDLGYGKGSASGYLSVLIRRPSHPGSCSGPIVADGLIWCSSFRPAGPVWAENQPHLHNLPRPLTDEEQARLRQQLRISADDLLIALDQKTGRLRWKAVEEDQGVNRYMGKRLGFGVTPVWWQDRVFSLGTTGRLYAYEARTGTKIWQTHIGAAHRQMEARKQECLARKTLLGSLGWYTSLVVAEGVLVVPLFDQPGDIGLRGVDPATGKTMWEVPQATSSFATPAVVEVGARQYLLTGTLRGTLQMIEPRSGRILWTIEGLPPQWASLITSAEHVIVNVGSRRVGPKRDIRYGRYGAYRFTTQGARQAWVMPDEPPFLFCNWMDACAHRAVLLRDGTVYMICRHDTLDQKRHLHLVDEATGRLRHSQETPYEGSLLVLAEDRLLRWKDAAHSGEDQIEMYRAEPSRFRRLGSLWKPPLPASTGYEVYLEYPYVDGCLFQRTETGRLACYDLRQT